MRAGIRERLILQIPSIGGRVCEAHDPISALDKPYVLLIQGPDAIDTDWTGYRTTFECWPCVSTSASFGEVDELSRQIATALDGQVLADPMSDRSFTCRYEGNSGTDKVDTDRDAITRGLKFSIIGIQNPAAPEETRQDPWLDALAAWTRDALGVNEWQAYCGSWPMNHVRPSVMWRWEGIESTANTRVSTIEVRKKAIGHVLGRTLAEQTTAAAEIAQRLTETVKIPLSVPDRRYLTISAPIVDLEQDALTEGQISVTLSRKIERHLEQGELMRAVHFQPKS